MIVAKGLFSTIVIDFRATRRVRKFSVEVTMIERTVGNFPFHQLDSKNLGVMNKFKSSLGGQEL